MIFGFFKKKKPKEELEEIGQISHYFPHAKAGVVKLDKGTLEIGDTIRIIGNTTNFKQKVKSLQVNNKPIEKATEGKEIGLLVKKRVRGGDKVFKV